MRLTDLNEDKDALAVISYSIMVIDVHEDDAISRGKDTKIRPMVPACGGEAKMKSGKNVPVLGFSKLHSQIHFSS